ncbi:hypothetical protein Ct61P_15562 [Colletotrichum tofieldiae]|nr:hypothetical protein Ct61P_15562 [Colletotrichum tofieldiae]
MHKQGHHTRARYHVLDWPSFVREHLRAAQLPAVLGFAAKNKSKESVGRLQNALKALDLDDLLKHAPVDFPDIRDAIRTGMFARVWSNPTLTRSASTDRPRRQSGHSQSPRLWRDRTYKKRQRDDVKVDGENDDAVSAQQQQPPRRRRYKEDEIQELGRAYIDNLKNSG